MWLSRLVLSVAVCSVSFVASAASADDPHVIRKLTRHGKLSNSAARQVSSKVGKRMAKSADNFAPPSDPLRVAVSQRLFGSPTPPDPMSGAKIRLRLFSGLNSWALETLFKPRSGQLARCQQAFGMTSKQCEALVAAAGNISLADARKIAGGHAAPVMARRAPQRQRYVAQPTPKRKSRFGAYDSGFRGAGAARPAAQPRRVATAPARPAASRFGGAPARRPMAAAAPRRAPAARPAMNTGAQASTAAAYKARRAARMARLQQERAKKKAAMNAPSKSVPAAAKSAAGGGGAIAAATPKDAPEEDSTGGDAQLDIGFLDGLLDDPLGKK